ncbi:MAG: uroporphyrinogen-III synthase [Rhodocyclaceae bacterium]|nr:uroporphyrinogen-III synthase [Rhodocyclaceae bacterium]
MGESAYGASGAAGRPLAGRHVIVTRPAGQAAHLAEALAALGAHPVPFPVLAISDLPDPSPILDAAIRLDTYDLAVFVSPNAIERALAVILPRRPWPVRLRVAAIGRSSERALAAHGITDVIAPPERFDSEALLEMPALQHVRGWRVLVFRGDGGRELLGDTLKARGAEVEYLTCYRRGRPDQDAAPLLRLWTEGRVDAVTVTSSEGLRNFFQMVGKLGQTWLRKTPVFVPHARIAEQARELGCRDIVTTAPGDDGLVAGLLARFAETAHVR